MTASAVQARRLLGRSRHGWDSQVETPGEGGEALVGWGEGGDVGGHWGHLRRFLPWELESETCMESSALGTWGRCIWLRLDVENLPVPWFPTVVLEGKRTALLSSFSSPGLCVNVAGELMGSWFARNVCEGRDRWVTAWPGEASQWPQLCSFLGAAAWGARCPLDAARSSTR